MENTAHAYVEHNGNKLSYTEAIEQNLVTINDIINSGARVYMEIKK